MDDLFLSKGFPRFYESVLHLPVIRHIRQQEQRTLREAFEQNLRAGDEVLEVGAGTGFYTFAIAARVKAVTALERSPGMLRILRERIAGAGARNISVVESDFFAYAPEKPFDAVIAIGVVDGVADAKDFFDRCISLARRCVIATIPRSSFWASVHTCFGGMLGVHIRVYAPEQIAGFLNGSRYALHETGLRTRWTSGLTYVAVIDTEARPGRADQPLGV